MAEISHIVVEHLSKRLKQVFRRLYQPYQDKYTVWIVRPIGVHLKGDNYIWLEIFYADDALHFQVEYRELDKVEVLKNGFVGVHDGKMKIDYDVHCPPTRGNPNYNVRKEFELADPDCIRQLIGYFKTHVFPKLEQ